MSSIPVEDDRIRSLDGLRGLAAVAVLLHHVSLLHPAISDHYLVPGSPALAPGSVAWWLTGVPGLNLLAVEAVLLFFVLSGVVLTLPALRAGFDWLAYYPHRFLRLMLPVVASLVLAYLLALATPQDPATAGSSWAAGYSFRDPDPFLILTGAELLTGSPILNNPLWSLRYELLFSLMLPLFVVLAVTVRRWWAWGVLACLVAVALGDLVQAPAWRYLAVFLVGTLVAVGLPALRSTLLRIPSGWFHVAGAGSLVLAAVVLQAHGEVAGWLPHGPVFDEVASAAPVLSAALIVVAAILWAPFARLLTIRPMGWLGRISFSLYLVHVPVLLSVNAVLADLPWWVAALVALPLAFVVAELFARFVEGPAHDLSKRVGREIAARSARLHRA